MNPLVHSLVVQRLGVILFALLALFAVTSRAEDRKPLDYMLVITGEELLRGVYPDAHTSFITRTLHYLGCHCVGSMIVDDNAEDIKEALRICTKKVHLVITTGGLGPTVNDVTRNAVADFAGVELREDPDLISQMERKHKQPRDQIRPNLRRQTQVPIHGGYLKALNGTAAGLIFEFGENVIVSLPGPPRELQPMVKNELVPYLSRKFGVRSPGSSVTIRFVGIGQSMIDQTMKEHVPLPPGVLVGSQFEGGRVDFTFMLPGDTPQDQATLKQLAAKIREQLGEYIYAEDDSSLEEVVARKLIARNARLSLVETGTCGRLAASLAGFAETSRVLTGAHVATTLDAMKPLLKISGDAKDEGLLKALALAAGTDWSIVTGDVDSEKTDSRSCSVLFHLGADRWVFERIPVRGTGETLQANLVTQIWDRLRRLLN